MKHAAHQYAVDVTKKRIVACDMVRLAAQRYLDDLESGQFEFHEKTATVYIEFFRRCLKHTVGQYAGTPFEPLPWQQFILWNLYGFHMPNGRRRFNYAYISVGRKQGKTTLMAGMALAAMILDNEQSAEIYSAATKRDQSRIVFDEARRMVLNSPTLKKYLTAGRHEITAAKTFGRFTYLSSDANTLDGTNPHLAIIDEYHGHATDEVSNVIKSGMQARQNPLHMTITTAGLNKNVPCFKLHQTCAEILRGVKNDPAQFAIMYELDERDEKKWTNPAVWIKSNPSMGHTITETALAKQCRQAVNMGGSAEIEFRTKHLNVWTTSAKTWIPDRFWNLCESDMEPTGPCFGGLDLASVSDLTTLVLIWPTSDNVVVRGWYWLPRDTYETALAQNPGHIYRQFAELDNFTLTDGNATDYDAIRRTISGVHIHAGIVTDDQNNLMRRHQIEKIAFDRYNSTQIAIHLVDDGVPIVPYGQGFVSMSPGAKQLEILVRSGRIAHDGDPVLRWCLGNVELKTDPAGNIKPDKSKSTAKIDPIVAMCMAIGEHLRAEPGLDPDAFRVLSL